MTNKSPTTNHSEENTLDRRTVIVGAVAASCAAVGLSAPARAIVDPDAELVAMFEAYKDALYERDSIDFRAPLHMEEWRAALRMRDRIVNTPAKGLTGIAVKLAMCPFLFDRAPIRTAFADAQRLAGIDLVPYEKKWPSPT